MSWLEANKVLGAEEEDLFEIFDTQAGPVDSVRIVRDEFYKVSKGFAYVKMQVRNETYYQACWAVAKGGRVLQSPPAMENALLLDGRVNYQGRMLRVNKAVTDKNQLEAMKNAVAYQKRRRMNTKKSAKQITQKLKQKSKTRQSKR